MTKKISQENKIELANMDQKDCSVYDIKIMSGQRFKLKENQAKFLATNNNETIRVIKRITCV